MLLETDCLSLVVFFIVVETLDLSDDERRWSSSLWTEVTDKG